MWVAVLPKLGPELHKSEESQLWIREQEGSMGAFIF